MFEIKISNKDRERSHTVNLGTEVENRLYMKLENIVNEFVDGSTVSDFK